MLDTEVLPRLPERPLITGPVRAVAVWTVLAVLSGCSWMTPQPDLPPVQDRGLSEVEHSRFLLADGDSVFGQLATVTVNEGDTLPDIARHFGLGFDQIESANPGVDPWTPRAGQKVLLPIQFVIPDVQRKGVAVNVATMRMFLFAKKKGESEVATYPVGVGREGRSTPIGEMYVARKSANPVWHVPESIRRDHALKGDPLPAAVLPGPDNPLGNYALYLSRPSYLIHGTNKPYAIGLRASNGCLRLYPEDVEQVYKAVPLKTPVRIVNQPYLLGKKDGAIYLEAHEPHEELNAKKLKTDLWAKLKDIERRGGKKIDWDKVASTVKEARGIPVPVEQGSDDFKSLIAAAVEVDAPSRLYGQPKIPELREKAWYVKALDSEDEVTARRFAAMLNHQGPQIPARAVEAESGRYMVLAGPFSDAKTGKKMLKRLKVDLEITGKLITPETRIAVGESEMRAASAE